MKHLVIVESPTKAKTIRKYLGSDYVVTASMGHVRDLPSSSADIPASVKKEKWAQLGVNVDAGFEPRLNDAQAKPVETPQGRLPNEAVSVEARLFAFLICV